MTVSVIQLFFFILPSKNGGVTYNEDIDEDKICNVVPCEVSVEIGIIANSSVNEEVDFLNLPSTSVNKEVNVSNVALTLGTTGFHKTK